MAIQPKNTNDILSDTLSEKTGAAGVMINSSLKVVSGGAAVPVSATIDIGLSDTTAHHLRALYTKAVNSSGVALGIGTLTTDSLNFINNNLTRFSLNSSGDIVQDATSGRDISLTNVSTALLSAIATAVSAAGTTITDATQLTACLNRLTAVSASQGVKLWNARVGTVLFVWNTSGITCNIFPSSGTDRINGGTVGAAITLATATLAVFWRDSATNWASFKFAVTTS